MLPAFLAYRKAFLASLTILAMIAVAPSLLVVQLSSQALAMHFSTDTATTLTASRNWSGYIATNGTFTSVIGTWVVPQVTSSGQVAADATWVGIGGLNTSDLVQSGTQNIVSRTGQVTTLAFFEMLPNAAQPLPVSIRSGDSVTVSLTVHAANLWRVVFQDNTNRQAYTMTVFYPSSFSTAEWIEEAPSRNNKILSLDNFGSVQFSRGSTIEAGNQVTIAQSNAQPIILVNRSHKILAIPSPLDSAGASFTVTRK